VVGELRLAAEPVCPRPWRERPPSFVTCPERDAQLTVAQLHDVGPRARCTSPIEPLNLKQTADPIPAATGARLDTPSNTVAHIDASTSPLGKPRSKDSEYLKRQPCN